MTKCQTLETALRRGTANHFNLLRVFCASLVILSHSFPLAHGAGAWEPADAVIGFSFGKLAVFAFFAISGLLVGKSLFQSRSLSAFALARLVRIYPGLIACSVFTTFVVGALFSNLSMSHYFMSRHTYTYAFLNSSALKMQAGLPGLFENNPFPGTVNGSLWTLPFEMAMYIMLVLLGYARIRDSRRLQHIFAVLYLSFYIAFIMFREVFPSLPLLGMLHELSFPFFCGLAGYIYRANVKLSWRWFSVTVLFAVASWNTQIFPICLSILVVYTTFCLAFLPNAFILRFNRLPDVSYGLYIYAFPIQQVVVSLVEGISPLVLFLATLPPTLCLGYLSSRYIEAPAMTWRKRLYDMVPGAARTGPAEGRLQ